MSKTYQINEIFYSIQGEGKRCGTANVFVRFSGCNMKCDLEEGPDSPGGFKCDTEFESGRRMTAEDIVDVCTQYDPCSWVILTGGEPALQLDRELVQMFRREGFRLAIETNGSINIDEFHLDWVTVSPKVAEHAIEQLTAHELKYVRGYGQGIPRSRVKSENLYISPAFDGMDLTDRNLQWCLKLVKENPTWRLSPQMHKIWMVR